MAGDQLPPELDLRAGWLTSPSARADLVVTLAYASRKFG
jgi:hypothetical protein